MFQNPYFFKPKLKIKGFSAGCFLFSFFNFFLKASPYQPLPVFYEQTHFPLCVTHTHIHMFVHAHTHMHSMLFFPFLRTVLRIDYFHCNTVFLNNIFKYKCIIPYYHSEINILRKSDINIKHYLC